MRDNWFTVSLLSIACLTIGYFVGQEHMKYQLFKATQAAALKNSKGMTASPQVAIGGPPVILISLINKDYKQMDIQSGIFHDSYTVKLLIKNLGKVDVEAFNGDVTFTNELGNELMTWNFTIHQFIKSGADVVWTTEIDNTSSRDERFRDENVEHIRTRFTPAKIVFADGTLKDYGWK